MSLIETLLAMTVSGLTIVSLALDMFRRRANRIVRETKAELADARSLGTALAKGYFYNFLAPLLEGLTQRALLKSQSSGQPIPYDPDHTRITLHFPDRLTFGHLNRLERRMREQGDPVVLDRPHDLRDLGIRLRRDDSDEGLHLEDTPGTLKALTEYFYTEARQQAEPGSTLDPERAAETPLWLKRENEEYPRFKKELEALYRSSSYGRNNRIRLHFTTAGIPDPEPR